MSIIEKAIDKLVKDPVEADAPRSMDAAEPAPHKKDALMPKDPGNETLSPPDLAGTELEQSATVEQVMPASVEADAQAPIDGVGAAPQTAEDSGATGNQKGGFISFAERKLEGILSETSERSRAAEEYRMIKRPLLMRALSGGVGGDSRFHNNLIMMTSSIEGEGKTFTSLNLAISMAMEMDQTVLLVDADLAKPGLSRLLEINGLPGLTDRLIDETSDLADLLLSTDIPKFKILPAGRRHRRSTELLASSTMGRLLDEMALRYTDRIILFDSPPILATSEASVLAQQMGQICLVVESAVTPQYLVKDALARFETVENVSLILNKCQPDLFLGRYGYGYGYNYNYGYRYGYGYGYGKDS